MSARESTAGIPGICKRPDRLADEAVRAPAIWATRPQAAPYLFPSAAAFTNR